MSFTDAIRDEDGNYHPNNKTSLNEGSCATMRGLLDSTVQAELDRMMNKYKAEQKMLMLIRLDQSMCN